MRCGPPGLLNRYRIVCPNKSQFIFLAEDTPEDLADLVCASRGWRAKPPILSIVTPVSVGTATKIEQRSEGVGIDSAPLFRSRCSSPTDARSKISTGQIAFMLGTTSNEAVLIVKQIFHPLVMRGVPVIVTNHETAELVREAATAFVATKISFINELPALCEHVDADAVNLSLALGLDKKIAPRCLQPGAGMGGLFAESDMESLAELGPAERRVAEGSERRPRREPKPG